MTQMRYYEKAFFCILHGTVYFCIILYIRSDQNALYGFLISIYRFNYLASDQTISLLLL